MLRGLTYFNPWVVMGVAQVAIWALVIGGILMLKNHR